MKSEDLYKRHLRAARPVVRRLLKQLGVWGVLGVIEDLVFAERERLYNANPNDPRIDDLDVEFAFATQLASFLETDVDWRRRRLKKK